MSNKDIFLKMFDEKINKNLIYENIISNYEHKNHKFRYILVPICFIFLIITVYSFKHNNIVINNASELETLYNSKWDLNDSNCENELNMYEVEYIEGIDFYKNVSVPFSIDYFKIYKILYSKSKYIIHYKSNDNKNISILFSLDGDVKYKQNDVNKKSNINGISVEILYDYSKYIAIFNCNDIYFNIEGNNISQNDFVDFIKNIIRGEK